MPGNPNQQKPWTADDVLKEWGISLGTATRDDLTRAVATAEDRNMMGAAPPAPARQLDQTLPAPDPQHVVTDQGIREAMTYLAGMLDDVISAAAERSGQRMAFCLFIFDQDKPATFYVSNAQRDAAEKMIRAWLAREGVL